MTLLRLNRRSLNDYLTCFIHIPKTAGSSFTALLTALFGRDKFRVVLPDVLDGHKEPDFEINDFQGISGHFPFEIARLISRPAILLTFLRDPVARSLSHFKEILRADLDDIYFQKSQTLSVMREIRQLPFEDFVEHPHFRKWVANLQTRMLGLLIDRPVRQLKEMRPVGTSEDRTYSVELAKKRLEDIAFLGLQERFQDSIDMFSYQFGFYPVRNLPTFNVSSEGSQLSKLQDSVKEKILQLNDLDVELYEFGKKIFAQRYEEMITSLQSKHKPAEHASVYEMLAMDSFEQNRIGEAPFRYEFEEIYQKSGWHPVERLDGNVWTWSGPGNVSTIDLPLDRSRNLRVWFEVRYFIESDLLDRLTMRIDGQAIHLIHIIKEGKHLFTGVIPAHPGKKHHTTQLSFHLKRTAYPPGMTAESPGARLLGIALSWVQITEPAKNIE